MAVMRITGTGLAAISLSVAGLWGCIMGEQVILRHAARERARALNDIQRLQRRIHEPVPASAPAPRLARPIRPAAG